MRGGGGAGGGMSGGRGGRGQWNQGPRSGPPGGGPTGGMAAPQFSHGAPGIDPRMDPNLGGWHSVGHFPPQSTPFMPPPNHPPPALAGLSMGPPTGRPAGQSMDARTDHPSNPVQMQNDESNPGSENMNPTRAVMDLLTQSLKTQGETAVTLQREQHAFLERMAERSNDTQVRMMAMLSGKTQQQIADRPTSLEGVATNSAMGAAGGSGLDSNLDTSFESRFEDMDERDSPLPPLIDTNFLIKELWDPQMRADFAFGRFDGSRMT